ncbi:STAS/SEC14 domain-containing protein [Motilimonas cestriensis]|uniref:STAS/SEC14 domain-containing protein n=1 Tax=Motilimonas cestriensis TaxID=2742685 RepID=UPI003DA4936D
MSNKPTQKHGLAIGIDRIDQQIFMTLTATGKLTHQDYELITPMLEAAIKQVPDADVKVLADISQFQGWELRAAWDDFKLGLKHGAQFSKIAIVGHKDWQDLAAKVGSWFISGEIKTFHDERTALLWLHAKTE